MSDNAPDRPRLTVALIVRNAAGELRATLDSVRPIADEIVLLDTGSTDDTPRLAGEYGLHLHRQPWDDDFAAARNECLAKTSGDWILWLDAGERLAPEDAARVREFVDAHADSQHAYLLPIVLPSASGEIGGEQVLQVRLHPLEEGIAFAGRVRERLDDSLAAAGIAVEALNIPIHRGERDHDPAVKAARAQRNIRLADLASADAGPTAALHNCLGEALQALGDPLRAAHQYQRAMRLADAESANLLEGYYGLLTCLDATSQDRSAQLTLCMEAVERFPLDAQLLVALGGYLQALEQPQLAMRAYDVAFRHGQIEPRIWHLPDIREIAAVCAATIHQLLGESDQARTLLEAAARSYPESLRIARQLIELHVKQGQRDEALAAVAALPLNVPARESWAVAIRGACLARDGNWFAARSYLQTATSAGCRERFCLRWLVVSRLGLGDLAGASQVLADWQAFDAENPELAELQRAIHEASLAPAQAGSGQVIRVDVSQGAGGPTANPSPSLPASSVRRPS